MRTQKKRGCDARGMRRRRGGFSWRRTKRARVANKNDWRQQQYEVSRRLDTGLKKLARNMVTGLMASAGHTLCKVVKIFSPRRGKQLQENTNTLITALDSWMEKKIATYGRQTSK